jgi:hypothetical protein
MPEAELPEIIALEGDLIQFCDDARSLLEFALTERRAPSHAVLEPATLEKITAVVYPRGLPGVPRQTWNEFLAAYETLSIFTYPVTAQTLRDTAESDLTFVARVLKKLRPVSARDAAKALAGSTTATTGPCAMRRPGRGTAAGRVTEFLWVLTWLFLGTIGATELLQVYTQDREPQIFDFQYYAAHMLTAMQPFLYGGLGACAYLLRSAHRLIAARAFNGCYRPEYFNRILLGIISGGTVSMFVAVGVDPDTTGVALSNAALGFLAGYSTDFLFKTIERILEALFPRDTTALSPPAPKPPTAKTSE